MDIFKDFWRFLGVVFLGMKDDSRAFIENLEAAERYNRWGDERKDLRDYQKALKHCEDCIDKYAPKPDTLARKYTTLFEILLGIIRLRIARFIQKNNQALNGRGDMEGAVNAARKSLQASYATIQKLERDGNMIKAQGERSHADELERNLAHLEEDLNHNDPCMKLKAEYQQTLDECRQYKTRMELSFAAVQQIENLPSGMLDQIIVGARSQLSSIEEELYALAPGNSASSMEEPQALPESAQPPAESS
ncbi:MAG: hypothetical protein JXA52_07915 [Planctomycetes bacterium]|nr:hypothetical protein [Planctomycetota bacterium]